jgi:hypothetical protein
MESLKNARGNQDPSSDTKPKSQGRMTDFFKKPDQSQKSSSAASQQIEQTQKGIHDGSANEVRESHPHTR